MRILVIQTAFLGDVVMTTPLLAELRRARPAARLTLLTTAGGAQLLQGATRPHEVLVLDKRWDRAGLRSYVRVLGDLRRGGYDVALAPHRSVRTGVLLAASRARRRVGFEGAPGRWAYDLRMPWRREQVASRRYLELVRAVGGDPDCGLRPHLDVDPEARRRLGATLTASGVPDVGRCIVLAPGSVWATKRWTVAGFAEVARRLGELGRTPVIVGSVAERSLGAEVAALSGIDPPVLAGELSIPEWVALCAGARAVVANDSATGHVAAAVGTPVVSIFGPTVPAFGQVPAGSEVRVVEHTGLDCRPCGRHGHASCPRGHFRCMREIGPEEVMLALEDLSESPRHGAVATPEGPLRVSG